MVTTLSLLALACAPLSGGLGSSDTGGSDTGGAPGEPDPIALGDGDLVGFSLDLAVSMAPLEQLADARLTWRTLSVDLQGLPLAESGRVSRVDLVRYGSLEPEDVLHGLATGTLGQRDVTIMLDCLPEAGGCALSEFAFEAGHGYDAVGAFAEGSGTWLASAFVDEHPWPAAFLLLDPLADSQNHRAAFTDSTSELSVQASVQLGRPIPVPGGVDTVLHWGDLTLSSFGGSLDPRRVDRVVLAQVSAAQPLESLVARLAPDAVAAWEADVSAADQVSLGDLVSVHEPGARFAGFDDLRDERWLLGLYCGSCGLQPLVGLVELDPQ